MKDTYTTNTLRGERRKKIGGPNVFLNERVAFPKNNADECERTLMITHAQMIIHIHTYTHTHIAC